MKRTTLTLLTTVAALALSTAIGAAQSSSTTDPKTTTPSTSSPSATTTTPSTTTPSASTTTPSTKTPTASTTTPSTTTPSASTSAPSTKTPTASTSTPSTTAPTAQQSTQPSTQQAAAPTAQQSTQISAAIQQQNVTPVRVNFALNVGVAVPTSVRLAPLPTTIVSIVPQYRGYSYFVTDERIVIVEPASHKIVYVLPMEGRGHAAATTTTTTTHKLELSKEQRASIKKHATVKRTATTGSSRRVTVEETIPADVELHEFSDVVVKEVPSVRSYRYINRGDDVVVVDPGSRRVLEVIE